MKVNTRIKCSSNVVLKLLPGRVCVSLTHCPGLGSGTLDESTGSQAELEDACSLNLPMKAV